MVFNFIDKNNVGSTIKNNGSTQTKKQPVIGTLFSCVKEAVPETAPAYYFYYVREENKLWKSSALACSPLLAFSISLWCFEF